LYRNTAGLLHAIKHGVVKRINPSLAVFHPDLVKEQFITLMNGQFQGFVRPEDLVRGGGLAPAKHIGKNISSVLPPGSLVMGMGERSEIPSLQGGSPPEKNFVF